MPGQTGAEHNPNNSLYADENLLALNMNQSHLLSRSAILVLNVSSCRIYIVYGPSTEFALFHGVSKQESLMHYYVGRNIEYYGCNTHM